MGGSFAFAAPPIEQGRPTLINQPGIGAGTVVTEQQLQQRLDQLDRRFASQEGVGQLLDRVMQMENEVRTLRGEVEELTDQLRRANADARERYIDLDRRLSSGTAATPPMSAQPSAPATEAGSEEAERMYRRARDLLAERQYEESVAAFQEFVDVHPDDDLTDDAWFWMGEVHTLLREYDEAQVAYDRVLEDFAESDKRIDALFKLGFVAERTGEIDDALDFYRRVMEAAPNSSLANLAEQRVTTLQ
ncbi:MAG: tetratricopeptide repeat protein [Natronospirillum sp.]